jgi:ribosomal protein S19
MKCIDDELTQKFIDGETDVQETARIRKHLTECTQCAQKVEEQRTFTETIKRELGNLGKQSVIIPEFVTPTIRTHRFNRKIRYYIYAASAACVISFVVFLLREQSTEPERNIQLIYCFDGEFDSNKTVSQQEMTIVMIDANGKILEYNEL